MTYQCNSAPYELELLKIGIKLGESFKRANAHHQLICTRRGHQWVATSLSKLQAYKKYGHNGCPECNNTRIAERECTISPTKHTVAA